MEIKEKLIELLGRVLSGNCDCKDLCTFIPSDEECQYCLADQILSMQGVNSKGEPVRLAVVKVEGKLPHIGPDEGRCPCAMCLRHRQVQQDMLDAHFVQEDK